MDNKKKFFQICKDIKQIKIQGATEVAKSAITAYSLFPSPSSKKHLLSLRPTEPAMYKALSLYPKLSLNEILNHFKDSQEEINKLIFKLISKNDVIYTHCHSSSVIKSLIYAKKKKKSFQVYNTETRPLFQGRKTSKELSNAGIKNTLFLDSLISSAFMGTNNPKVKKIFLGADAITKKGVINKAGSLLIAELAKLHKIHLYIVTDSWKFTLSKVPIEYRDLNEIWDNAPKNIKIKNPAFEFIPKKYIYKVVSEFGVLDFKKFVKLAKKSNAHAYN